MLERKCACPGPVDLTENDTVLFRLLDDTRAWRVRTVERITLNSALWSERRRTTHVHPSLRKILSDISGMPDCLGEHEFAQLILPVGGFPKGPRIDLEIEVARTKVDLLSRNDHGFYESRYIKYLCRNLRWTGVPQTFASYLDGDVINFLGTIFGFHSEDWRRYRQGGRPDGRAESAHLPASKMLICRYLISRMGWDQSALNDLFGIHGDKVVFDQWWAHATAVGEVVRKYQVENIESAPENPLLALPLAPSLATPDDATRVLSHLHSFIKTVYFAAKDPRLAPDAVRVIARYARNGSYWEAFARCTVPLDESFLIETAEKRITYFGDVPEDGIVDPAIDPAKTSLRVRQLVEFKDAKSNQVTVRVPDTNVEFNEAKWKVSSERNDGPLTGTLQGVTSNIELYAAYSSRDDRPERMWFTCKLRQTLSVRLTIYMIQAILATTIAFLWWLGYDYHHVLTIRDMAGLLFPASIAAALLLTRSNTTLGMRVNRVCHFFTAGLLGLLAVTAIALFWLHPPKPEAKLSPVAPIIRRSITEQEQLPHRPARRNQNRTQTNLPERPGPNHRSPGPG